MPKIPQPPKKLLRPKYILALIVFLFIAYFTYIYTQGAVDIQPEELLNTAINNTVEATSYQFHTKSTITIDGKEKVFSDIQGKRADEQSFHVVGSMLGSEINVYQINDTTYRLDGATNKWVVTKDNPLLKESLLMAELNPLTNFYFEQLISASYLGREKIQGKKLFKIACVPKINNKWLDGYFKDLNYLVWIDGKNKLIKKATVTALSKENENGSLKIEVEFKNFNKEFNIQPPVV